ncbi:hypothetical protein [Bacteroides sp. 224]|uniref:hypothetical protein n=1 Tax=Bacteroides sp. 224 TaxID=2302936 RepID=UPI0013CF558A|nr:hypothetical protein [Bacteroides sp. 224]NDV65166.1 hypothetical protein [Bacteroides sp. 224]
MKTKCFLISAFALFTALSLVSCSDDDDKPEVIPPVFPELEEITLEPNNTKEISFTANKDWKIEIEDAATNWLTFIEIVGEEEKEVGSSDQGSAGEIKRTIKVKDDAWSFAEESAEIKLTMGGESKAIYKITRIGKERIVKLFVGNAAVDKVELKFTKNVNGGKSNMVKVGFVANFDWVASMPEVIEMEAETITGLKAEDLGGKPKSDEMDYINMKLEFITSAYNGVIKVKDANDSDFEYEVPLTYTGIGDEEINFVTKNRFNMIRGGIKFNDKGFFIEEKQAEKETQEKKISFAVETQEMKYKSYLVQFDESNKPIQVQPANSWLDIQEKDGNFEIAISGDGINTGDFKALYLLILPEKMTSGTVNFADYLKADEMNETTTKGLNYVVRISQKAAPLTTGFVLLWGVKGDIAAENVIDASNFVNIIGNGAPVGNTYKYSFTNTMLDGAGALQIKPNGWKAEGPGLYELVEIDGADWSTVELSFNMPWPDFLPVLNLDKLAGATGPAAVLFYDSEADKTAGKPMGAILLMKD